jgi:hypothetical protein
MYNCSDCGSLTDNQFEGRALCKACEHKRNESQDERRREGDERHGK